MDEQDLKDFLQENREAIQSQVRQKIIEKLLADYHWNISDQIGKTVGEFVADEIIPEVKAHLQGEKGAILEGALNGAREIGDLIAKQMVENAAKNLATSWRFNPLMKSLFEG